ncbi:MAG: chromosome partitioning protein [Acidobacteria bacterium]|nr:chromosome partitioning protein [Acidobacteriota bacterium]
MSLIGLCSAHGSPGATTTALAFAATWPEHRRCLLIEADPFGGVIGPRYRLGDTPGLSSLAAVARGGLDEETVWRNVQQLPGGVPVLVGPASAEEAHAVLADVAGVLTGWCTTQTDVDVIVDCGRIGPTSPTIELLVKADAVLVLARPRLDQIRPAAHRLSALKASGVEASLLLVGDKPYGPDEVAVTLNVDVGGVIAWDPRTAAVLTRERGAVSDLRRSPLVRSAATLTDRLAGSLSESSRSDGTASTPPVAEVEVAEEARR